MKLKPKTQSTSINKEHWKHKLRYKLKNKTLQLFNERVDRIETQNVYNNNCSSTNTRALTKITYSKHQLKAILRAPRTLKGECKKKEKNGEAWRWHSKLQNNFFFNLSSWIEVSPWWHLSYQQLKSPIGLKIHRQEEKQGV